MTGNWLVLEFVTYERETFSAYGRKIDRTFSISMIGFGRRKQLVN